MNKLENVIDAKHRDLISERVVIQTVTMEDGRMCVTKRGDAMDDSRDHRIFHMDISGLSDDDANTLFNIVIDEIKQRTIPIQ